MIVPYLYGPVIITKWGRSYLHSRVRLKSHKPACVVLLSQIETDKLIEMFDIQAFLFLFILEYSFVIKSTIWCNPSKSSFRSHNCSLTFFLKVFAPLFTLRFPIKILSWSFFVKFKLLASEFMAYHSINTRMINRNNEDRPLIFFLRLCLCRTKESVTIYI